MQELIKITTNEQGSQVVSARELYEFLGMSKAVFARWSKKNIEENPFAIEWEDWIGFNIMLNGNEAKDFALTLDFAKRLAQMARTEKGEEVRKYFIECEKSLRQQTAVALPSVKELALMVLKAEEEKELLLAENAKLAPKAEWTDKVLQSDNTYTTTNIAKELGIGVKQLNAQLVKMKIQFWHDGRYVLSANYDKEKYTATRTSPYIDSKGVQHTNTYMVWTERGRAFLHYLFNEDLSYGKPAKAKRLVENSVNILPQKQAHA